MTTSLASPPTSGRTRDDDLDALRRDDELRSARQDAEVRALRRDAVALLVPGDLRPRVTSDEFWRLCAVNEDLRLELTSHGELIAMWPAASDSGMRNLNLSGPLYVWAKNDRTGRAFDSSAGFTLPNTAVRSPDASWIKNERWDAFTAEERGRFAPICPDFVVELRSQSDSLAATQAKMAEYLGQGARLGWLLDPTLKRAEIYRAGGEVEIWERPATLSGEDVLPGFVLDLQGILYD